MKTFTQRSFAAITLCVIYAASFTPQSAFSQAFTYFQCAEVNGTNHGSSQLHVRMNGLHASIKANNAGGGAKTYTVTIKNIDPDFVTLSEGTTTAKGANTLTFSWSIPAGATQTVWINPWYLTPTNFYFIAWGDSQHQPERFQRVLAKASLINPVLSVGAGDCVKHGNDGGCVGCGNIANPQPVSDQTYQSYLQLFTTYPTSVFEALGNHDITRGGWLDSSDANYGAGERLWRKYMGATEYGFTVHPSDPSGGVHFLINRFYYDMPNWCARWPIGYFNGCVSDGFLRFDANDVVGVGIYNFSQNDLAAAQNASARISVTHHGFDMFIGDRNTVANARALYQNGNVNYMIVGHKHIYTTGTDGPTQIRYLTTGDANGDAHGGNPGFSLMRVNNGAITEQHMLADNLNLTVNYTANGPTLTQGKATVTCSGYNLPFVRLKFKLSKANAVYQAKDVATGTNIATYNHQFSDYTVVYVETSINNGATKNIQVDAVSPLAPLTDTSALSYSRSNEKEEGRGITVYPNPAAGQVTVTLPAGGKQPYHLVLYDMHGKPVKEMRSSARAVVISLSGLPQGAYLVRISAGNKFLATKRLIVEK